MRDPRETLARIRKQANAATEGPWEADPFTWKPGHPVPPSEWLGIEATGPVKGEVARIRLNDDEADADADAEFIAAARTDVPRLVAALDAVLDLADRLDAEAATLYNFSGGMSDESEWLEATATRIRTALAGVEGEG